MAREEHRKLRLPDSGAYDGPVTDKVLTVPNIISFARLCLAPAFVVSLLQGHDILAAVLFGLAAGTDWVDGQVARRTRQVSKLGKVLDPAIDRVLMICGAVALYLVGRLPLWMIVLVVARDLAMMAGYAVLMRRWGIRPAVVYAGKVATTFFFLGFFGLLLNMPQLAGLGLTQLPWLPGFSADAVSWGIWMVYAGLAVGLCTTVYYVATSIRMVREAISENAQKAVG